MNSKFECHFCHHPMLFACRETLEEGLEIHTYQCKTCPSIEQLFVPSTQPNSQLYQIDMDRVAVGCELSS
jgi:transcription elongation factor Elf1